MKRVLGLFIVTMVVGSMPSMADEKTDTLQDQHLGEVVVTAQKPIVKQKDDRIIYDMKSDDEAKTNTLKDMLKKVPFVTIDQDGNIQIEGKGNIRIYKDGKPNNSLTKNAKQILDAIPASLIDHVDVIRTPGAKYDAEGVDGIIDIVFKKNTSLDGIMGQVELQTTDQSDPVANIYLAGKRGKLDISANYTFVGLMAPHSESDQSTEVHYLNSGNDYKNQFVQEYNGNAQIIGLEGSYDIDSLNLITMSLNGFLNNVNIDGHGDVAMMNGGDVLYAFHENYDNSRQSYYNFDGKIDFQHLTHRQGEILTASYLLSTSNTHSQIGENYSDWIKRPPYYDYDRYYRDNDGRFVEHTLQIDWERPITLNHKLNFGAKYINRKNSSDGKQEHDDVVFSTNDFSHITNVAAAYAEYRFVSPKWSASAGLRYEYSYLKAKFYDGSADDYSRNLSDFVPFASVTYRMNDANTLNLNYSSRIERPGIDYLNPFRMEDMTQIKEGNPYLDSSRPNKITLSYTYLQPKFMGSFNLSSSFNRDGISLIRRDLDGKIYSTYGNIQKYQNYAASVFMRWQPSVKTNLTLNVSGGWTKVANDELAMSQSRWNWSGNMYLTQELLWKVKLNAHAGLWQGAINDVYSHVDPVFWHGISLQRSFLKEDRLTARIGVNNPFLQTQTYKNYMTQGDFTSKYVNERTARWISGSISYRFGSLKSRVKKAQKTITNDDLVGQKKSNN